QGGAPSHPTVKEDIKIILPKKAMVELKKFLSVLNDEDITFDITSNYVCFYLKGRQFLTKLIEGLYPDYENVIPQANNKTVVLQKDDFIKTLRRVSLISKEKGHLVKFTINESTLDFYANDPEVGEASDTIAAQLDGEPIALGFNSKFVIESVSVMDGERFKIVLLELLSPTLFMEYDNDNYKCVIMPVRL
ncbi:MAG: DNA polymerase III subunit beta, partial [Candidatus Magnetoovum sp. WYHC-5]|nr:DNA polymerase III subunit beta [Candidatus Magnetoovum sp. WYHC-5]